MQARIALSLTISLLSVAAATADPGAVSGSCRLGATTVPLAAGLAYRSEGADPAAEATTIVFLSSVPVDRGALEWATQRERTLREQMNRDNATWVQVTCKDKRTCWVEARLVDATGPHQQVFSTARGLKIGRLDPERVEGRLSNSFLEWELDLTFEVEVLSDEGPGSPLPPGGGEAGAAYLAYQAAIRAGDLAAMLDLVESGRAAALRLQIGDQPTPDTVDAVRASGLAEVEVVAGRSDADLALLEVRGVDQGGGQRAGKVLMRREGAAWKLAEASITSRAN